MRHSSKQASPARQLSQNMCHTQSSSWHHLNLFHSYASKLLLFRCFYFVAWETLCRSGCCISSTYKCLSQMRRLLTCMQLMNVGLIAKLIWSLKILNLRFLIVDFSILANLFETLLKSVLIECQVLNSCSSLLS